MHGNLFRVYEINEDSVQLVGYSNTGFVRLDNGISDNFVAVIYKSSDSTQVSKHNLLTLES